DFEIGRDGTLHIEYSSPDELVPYSAQREHVARRRHDIHVGRQENSRSLVVIWPGRGNQGFVALARGLEPLNMHTPSFEVVSNIFESLMVGCVIVGQGGDPDQV